MYQSIIAVSPFNGYFTAENMEKLFKWAQEKYDSFDIFTMDEISKYNLIAQGYDEQTAVKKTRKQDRYLVNKIHKCLIKLGFSEENAIKKVVFLSEICHNDTYKFLYQECIKLYNNDQKFFDDCLNATQEVLLAKLPDMKQNSILYAVNYLLAELPIWLNSDSVFSKPYNVLIYKDFPSSIHNIVFNYGLLSSNQKILIKNVEKSYERLYQS